jgi:hypothetical protein
MLTDFRSITQKPDHHTHTKDFPTIRRKPRRRIPAPTTTEKRNMNSREEFEKAKRMREKITNPEPPKPRPLAVRVTQGGRMCAGAPRQEGEILMVWPEEAPPGFISKQQARDLVEMGMCTLATDEEIETFLANNEPA